MTRTDLRPLLALVALAVAGCSTSTPPPTSGPGDATERIDVDAAGSLLVPGESHQVRLSGDGRYAVFATTEGLVAGDGNGISDVYRKDLQTGAIVLVSQAWGATGTPVGNGASDSPSISADGDLVAFASTANNLVAGDGNVSSDIFVVRISTGSVVVASVVDTTIGVEAAGASVQPQLTPDGHFVVFASAAILSAADTGSVVDIYRRDLAPGSPNTVLCSIPALGGHATADCLRPTVSADGDLVAFETTAPLVTGDTNALSDIYLRQVSISSTTRVSGAPIGEPTGASTAATITADGHYVGFLSNAGNLLATGTDTNGTGDAFIRNVLVGSPIERVDLADAGGELGFGASAIALSDDARYVVFASASPAVAGDINTFNDVFVRDRLTSRTRRASLTASGGENNGNALAPSISRDGSTIGFEATGTLLPGGQATIVHAYATPNPPTAGG